MIAKRLKYGKIKLCTLNAKLGQTLCVDGSGAITIGDITILEHNCGQGSTLAITYHCFGGSSTMMCLIELGISPVGWGNSYCSVGGGDKTDQ